MKWKTPSNQVPRGFDPDEFEDWLWRREKPKEFAQLGKLTDLRNGEIFPSFDALPNSNSVDLDSFGKVDGRLWCFLGEIVDSMTLHHLALRLTDVDNKNIPLHFETNDRGSELTAKQIQKGYTVAVLYAQRRTFTYGDPGISLEDPHMLKIFPVSLERLLELNGQVQQFSTSIDGIRTCHGCGKKASSLNRYGKCSLFWYCDSGCQRTGWEDRGHKPDCKLLKRPDLRGLFFLKWA
ncbi:hypothetical protein BDW02DRAFT_627740 [Decorospora gaudefroyi]|uniref:MYND-type domain-containing protein n=1 Tax=Decorospora gaudefroyi TaxID=184978 RepID=A0A6A5KT24_9PLEO|nr:hypothetical protein BDW02DRAFT_627740 [Decorospora gaudefroyi]